MPFTIGQYLTKNDLDSQEAAHTLGYGVVNGLKVIPEAPPSMDIEVEIGKAYAADTLVVKGAVTTLTVGGADPTNPRKDIVVCNSAGTLSIVAGTPEAALPSGNVGVYTLNPEPPSIPANSIILGEIWVPAGATEISGSEIYDKRVSIADFIGHKANVTDSHGRTAGVLPTGQIPGLDVAKIISGQFPLNRMPRAASGLFLEGGGVGNPLFNALVVANIPNLDASKITSGTFPVARGGTGLSTLALGGILYISALNTLSRLAPTAANRVLRSTAANALQFATLLAADIPNLDASKITTGQFPLGRMPRAASGLFLEGNGAADPIYNALVAANIPNLDAAKIVSGVFGLARIPNMDWAHISGLFPRTIADLLSDHNLAHHGLGVIVPHDALASLTEKAHTSLTGVTANQHHTKYTNAEAQATVKANVEVGDLKAPTKALQMNNQDISGVKDLTATKIIATTEMYIPAEP
ncbi:hypothetical protein ES703_88652 [subsurface metagenome]